MIFIPGGGDFWHGHFQEGTVDFIKIRNGSVKKILQYYCLARKYDIVYDTLNVVSKYLGLVPKFMRPFKLVTVMHHPPFDKQLRLADSDAYIFFSKELMQAGENADGRKAYKMYLNEWRPDYGYYERYKKENIKKVYDFVDCGRTGRDHETVVEALIRTNSTCLFFDKARMRNQNRYILNEGVNTFFYDEDFIPDNLYIRLMLSAKVMVLALPETDRLYGPIGATVLMDALALEMPLICSDNAYCCNLITENGWGLIYKSGDIRSLMACMERIKDNSVYESCIMNIKKYNSLNNGMQGYSDKVKSIFHKVLADS